MKNINKKERFTHTVTCEFPELTTDLEVYVTWQKKNFFSKQASVLIREQKLDKGQLFVEPHFERIANGILATKLKGTNPKNIRWFHYNPFHCPYNPESIGNYREVMPVVKDGKIIDAYWEDLHFMPPVN